MKKEHDKETSKTFCESYKRFPQSTFLLIPPKKRPNEERGGWGGERSQCPALIRSGRQSTHNSGRVLLFIGFPNADQLLDFKQGGAAPAPN